ncbi:VOC family protein [Massilia yuzhufengensis]|uniref:Catechol 2,3-dioxygenase n=1 Tax=Massilia yuzhufengensis TaxID=1164594 RepID=A0A1I1WID5_9BURK|nr:VOC family protein [Massilia yuzhufengensis]SFD93203.1 Catechol 2,3-dioxygenase [Massilia yuzhufengensis]
MLSNMEAIATVGVRDIEKARAFYSQVLGLQEGEAAACTGGEVLSFKSGNSQIYVYRSEFAGTNQATAITWDVGERIGEVVAALKARGASFEHYDMEGMQREGDIHIGGGMKVAWLKDPDGNILNFAGR